MRRLLAVALAVTGATCLVIALTGQQHPVAPERSLGATVPPPLSPPAAAAASPSPRLVLAAAAPVSLDIPAIGVRSSLLRLGQAADGTLAVPPPGPHYNSAGWYRYSPAPGALGPAVIVGHVDSVRSGPSVFFHLGELRPRDQVRVSRADGTVAVFVVDRVLRFAKAAFPTQLVYGNTDYAALRLITCGGPFDRTTGHYLDNVVVTARLVGSSAL
ncbi:MAG: hypothetical protein NVSMB55_22700 [Mycobacteriales bacterium]